MTKVENKELTLLVEELRTYFFLSNGVSKAVNNVSLEIGRGKVLCLVGESGSGKSMTALSIMKLIPEAAKIMGGKVLFLGDDLMSLNAEEIRKVRGNRISMIFQDPSTALDSLYTIGFQIVQAMVTHNLYSRGEAKQRAEEMLRLVGIPSPEDRMKRYPHEFSGGMLQRAMIAMALSCDPKLLIADEPTSSLDVTTQAQILNLIRDLRARFDTSLLMITHNMGLVAEMADEVAVMYSGSIVEKAKTDDILMNPRHPYTIGLLKCVPRLNVKGRLETIPGMQSVIFEEKGCPFSSRCKEKHRDCDDAVPELKEISPGHDVACHYV